MLIKLRLEDLRLTILSNSGLVWSASLYPHLARITYLRPYHDQFGICKKSGNPNPALGYIFTRPRALFFFFLSFSLCVETPCSYSDTNASLTSGLDLPIGVRPAVS
jgi:hypothetical protein